MSIEFVDNPSKTSELRSENVEELDLGDSDSIADSDEAELFRLGYRQSFAREFKNLATLSFAFSIMAVSSSIPLTLNTPLLSGGPASVVWCWFIGTIMCCCLGASVAEIVSAYPTNGGVYSASAYLVPKKYKPIVGWTVGWLNLLGQNAGTASVEFGLAGMILSAVTLVTNGDYTPTSGHTVGVFLGLLVIHGLLESLASKFLALITNTFIFVNLGSTVAIIIALLVTTENKHSAEYVFTNVNNQTGWSSNGLAFLLGLLSVQWTFTDYDATAHISEEIKRASYAAPVAIFVALVGSGILGWVYNIVFVLCSGDITTLPGPGGYAAGTILYQNVGKTGFLILWSMVCFTAFGCVAANLQANSRTYHAFSRDRGLPDFGLFSRLAPNKIPIYSVWLVCFVCAVFGMLDFVSVIALNAIFSLAAIALDTSYIIPIACKLIFRNHPEVMFKPGPFHLGTGLVMWTVNLVAIFWITFVVVILALPNFFPVTPSIMNYAGPMVGAVLLGSLGWFWLGGRKHYHGPRNVIKEEMEAAKQAATMCVP